MLAVAPTQQDAASTQQTRRPCTKQNYNDVVWSKRYDEQWTSFYGNWLHITNGGATQNGLRCFKYSDSTRLEVDQMNVYQKPFSPNAKAREHDSLYDVRYKYNVAPDSDDLSTAPLNVRTHDPRSSTLLAVGEVDREALAFTGLSVGGSAAAQQALAHLKSKGQLDRPYVLTELFLLDGPHRWSLVVAYKMESAGELMGIVFIQERVTRLNPEDADVVNIHADKALDIRPSLDANSASWVPASSSGTTVGIKADPSTGDLYYFDPEPVSFKAPPTADTPTHRAILLPDSMYCLVPHSAKCAQDGNGEDFWVELGGVMRRDGQFEQLRVSYTKDGALGSVTLEVYA